MLQAVNSLELAVDQERAKEKNTLITLLMVENPSYEPLCVDLAKKS